MKTTEQMILLNQRQARFYDAIQSAEAGKGHGGYAENQSANVFTRLWAGLRYRQQAAVREAGIESEMKAALARWVEQRRGGRFLELGCFSGSPATLSLAETAGNYRGIELSPRAVEELNRKFADAGLAGKAQALAGDFLLMDESQRFDLIYAHGVLHHFENPAPLFEKLAALLNPGGTLLFVEPSAVNPLYRAIRMLYRPFQSDAAWEWPFRRHTVETLQQHFEAVEGFGWGRHSLLLSVLTGAPLIGGWVTRHYVRLVRAEMAAGWHAKVWHNSMVTACFRRR
jgi:SAM-dependent methyltransferase